MAEEPKKETDEINLSIYLNCEIISLFKMPPDSDKRTSPFVLDVAAGINIKLSFLKQYKFTQKYIMYF